MFQIDCNVENKDNYLVQKESDQFKVNTMKESLALGLPNVIVAGAQKGGTTSISALLSSLTDVCNPQRFDDEPHWFNKEVHFFDEQDRYDYGVKFYFTRFLHCVNETLRFDATPDYIKHPERIASFYNNFGNISNVKILFSLREPVDREKSLLSMLKLKAKLNQELPTYFSLSMANATLEEYHKQQLTLQNLENPNRAAMSDSSYSLGMYGPLIHRWFKNFPRENILILSFDELRHDKSRFVERISSFLGVPMKFDKLPHANSGHQEPKSNLTKDSCIFEKKLANAFEKYSNQELYMLLNEYPGPPQEQSPFPHFLFECK